MKIILLAIAMVLAPFAQAQAPVVPIILVKGYGPNRSMNRMERFLIDDGFSPKHIYHVDYDHKADLPDLLKQATANLKAALSKYPAGTEFDLIGHSMGGFVSLYTAVQSEFADNIRHYVSLAGMTQGQDSLPGACAVFDCGKTIPVLVPFLNPFMKKFLADFKAPIDAADKCALFSPADRMIDDPYDAGALPGAKRVEVKDAGHLDFILDKDVFNIMQTTCFGRPAPAEGFKHTFTVK